MTLAQLVVFVQERTGAEPKLIEAIARTAWPSIGRFTETQATLVVNSVLRRRRAPEPGAVDYTIWLPERQEPRTITDEQLWGKK